MEPLTPAKRLSLISVAVALTATAGVVAYRQLSSKSLAQLARADLPTLALIVKLRDIAGNELAAESSRIADSKPLPEGDERCPALSGGDTASATVADANVARPADCPRSAAWYVKKHPIALTLTFNDGPTFLNWWDSQPQVKALADSRFVQGLFFGLLQSLKVKAEQLNLQGLQGEFLGQLLRDAIGAEAQLHYDLAHAGQGWVLSYRRNASRYSDQALPALAGWLASSAYKVDRLPQPILETRIGLQKLFFSELEGRIYLAQSLEALLNVLESLPAQDETGNAALRLTVRTEAVVANLLPAIAGAPTYPVQWDFALHDGELGSLNLPAARWQKQLHGQLFEGVLASIPHDAFAAVAAAVAVPADLTVEDWRAFADTGPAVTPSGPEPAGIGLVWDFSADSPSGAVGVIVANPGQPQASPAYAQYLKNPESGAECAGGSLFLAASSESLLTRMKDACARQSLSPLDWQHGAEKQRLQAAQVVAFVNPATALRELFLAGGAGNNEDIGDFAPRWQQDYEAAKTAMRREGEQWFSGLPILSYAGKVSGDAGARLEGKMVQQAADVKIPAH